MESSMPDVFAPGCALLLHKPALAGKLQAFLGTGPQHLTCCHHAPGLPAGTRIINVCPGCDRRYRELYEGISTISLWEILAECEDFPFPDHGGRVMSILDACPTRTEVRVHDAIRRLLERMNIRLLEPAHTRTKAACCGDSLYGTVPVEAVKAQMRKRALEMPCEDVVVYCVSCVKAMHIGGKVPRYLVDLLFGEATPIGTSEPDAWHGEIQTFIDRH
jgi:Fe-S oxidoreductase